MGEEAIAVSGIAKALSVDNHMLTNFHIVHIDFDTPESDDWHPPDPLDCAVWATVTVGDATSASNFQLHICTPISIRQIRDKRSLFMIDAFHGKSDLIAKLNEFIETQIADKPGDPNLLLAEYWNWEYS